MSLVLRYDPGNVQRRIARLPKDIEDAAMLGINEAVDFAVIVCRANCPVDTGTLMRSIRKHRSHRLVSILAGGAAYINPKTLRGCNYAVFIEKRYGFIKAGVETIKAYVKRLIRNHIVTAVS